jgi:hypothetical protein
MKISVTSLMVVDPAEGTLPKRPHRKRSKKPAAALLAAETGRGQMSENVNVQYVGFEV